MCKIGDVCNYLVVKFQKVFLSAAAIENIVEQNGDLCERDPHVDIKVEL